MVIYKRVRVEAFSSITRGLRIAEKKVFSLSDIILDQSAKGSLALKSVCPMYIRQAQCICAKHATKYIHVKHRVRFIPRVQPSLLVLRSLRSFCEEYTGDGEV